jgi:diguanylate cyclase (GGDEF)-like protein/PAS domain S-box-containing protein
VNAATPERSLSRRALLYVAIVCLAIIAVDAWREWTSYRAVLDRTETEALNLASSLRHHAEDTYEIAEQAVTLVALAVAPAVGDPKLASVRDFMTTTVETSGRLRSIHLIGPDGRLAASTAASLPAGEDRSRHSYFRYHQARPGPDIHIGPPQYSRDGAMELTVSRRIDDGSGRFAGVVVAAIDTRYFANIYSQIDTGEHGVITLFDDRGTLLTRHPYRPELVGRDMSVNGPFQALAAEPSGNYAYRSSVDGKERIGGWDRSSTFPLVTTVAIARNEALAAWLHGAVLRGLATLALTLVVAILGARLVEQIAKRLRSEAVLAAKEAEFRLLAESASDLVLRFDGDGKRTYISPAAERLLGYTPEELIGKNAFDILSPEDRPAVEQAADRLRRGVSEQETVTFRRTRKDGVELWLETSLRVAADAIGKFSVVGVTRDITERKRLEQQLEAMAMRDGLTGLANRRAFDSALLREVARARRSGTPLALLMIDADRFKRFNDDYGHLAGDTCLKAIAGVVALAARRPADVAARYGGEELALLLPETDLAAARAIAGDLTRQVEALAIPHLRNSPWKVMTVSIGAAAIDPHDTDTLHDGAWLISAADLALYDAKAHGRNQAIAARQHPGRRLTA